MIKSAFKRYGYLALLAISSQAISAAALFSLPTLGLHISDLYVIAIQAGMGPFNGYILGVLYLIVLGRPTFKGWKTAEIIGLVTAIIYFLTTLTLSLSKARSSPISTDTAILIALLGIFSLGGAALASAGVWAVCSACRGKPALLAGINLLPNIGMALGVMIAIALPRSLHERAYLPAICWTAFALCTRQICKHYNEKLPLWIQSARHTPERTGNKAVHLTGLLLGTVTNTVLPVGFVAAVEPIKTGVATYLFIVTRVGSSLISTFINSFLIAKYNWNVGSSSSLRLPARIMWLSCVVQLFVAILIISKINGLMLSLTAAIGWFVSLCAAPFIMRDLNFERRGLHVFWKSIFDILLTGCGLSILYGYPSIPGYFSVYIISQTVTCAIGSLPKRDKSLLISSIILGCESAFILFLG